jgi:hypothetical protein
MSVGASATEQPGASPGSGERRSAFYSPRNLAVLVVLAGAIGLVYAIHRGSQRPTLERDMGRLLYIDEQGRTFVGRLPGVGEAAEIVSPFKSRAYPAELCYWKSDGGTKSEPTVVLLRQYVEGRDTPTYCPDCGRLVIPGNPVPFRDELTGQLISVAPPMRAESATEPSTRPSTRAGEGGGK